jgi:hypothetical protein
MSRHYEVIVGNVGRVYAGPSQQDALEAAGAYIARSKASDGRAAGEPVTVLRDGEVFHEYTPAAAEETEAQS